MKEQAFNRLLSRLDIHPVLIDVGSSGATPEVWEPIAAHSIFVGFDPDLREIYETSEGHFHQSVTINEAITSDRERKEIELYLTKFPYCSSTLPPDFKSLSNFLFSDFFEVERTERVRATTLDAVLERLSLSRIDWLKLDTQGTDLRIFRSLKDDVRSRVLAVDIEPGLIDAYLGEDLFTDAHKALTGEGFWLSNLNVGGAVRMSAGTLAEITATQPDITRAFVEAHLKKSPGWCEARYLRSIESLGAGRLTSREYLLLWVFALLDGQLGYALELAVAYERAFGSDETSRSMRDETISLVRHERRRAARPQLNMASVKAIVPARTKRWIKKLIK
ncbi:MAG TPA: FkbM family methyltransferase [Pyrinomonadaceae bacterium]